MSTPLPTKRRSASTDRLDRFLLLALAWSFAVAQPLYDLLRRTPEFLVVHDLGPADVLLLVVVGSLGAPLALAVVEELAYRLARPLGAALHRLLAGSLLLVFFYLLSKRLFGETTWMVPALVALLPTLLVLVLQQRRATRLLVRYASPAVLIFPLVFLLDPGVRGVVFPPRPEIGAVTTTESEVPVVVLVFDGMPLVSLLEAPRTIDRLRYPHFAELAGEATWFVNAATEADTTLEAVPAILSGSYPRAGALPTHAYYPLNLFTLLGDDYRLVVEEPLTRLCPEELCPGRGLGRRERWERLSNDLWIVYLHLLATEDLRAVLPPVDNSWKDFREQTRDLRAERSREHGQSRPFDPAVVVERLCEGITAREPRSLYFLHSLVPHPAHRHFPSGRVYTKLPVDPSGEGRQFGEWSDDPWAAWHSYQRHLLQVAFADRLLGEVVGRLRQVGLYERALLVVTSDHGASFRPGVAQRRLSPENAADILSVPLLVKLPGQTEGRLDERPVQTVDILPTVAATLGIDLADRVDGHSLLDPQFARRSFAFGEGGERTLPVEVLRDRDETVSRKTALFGSGEPRGELVAPRLHPELIGRRLDELDTAAARGYRGRLEDAAELDDVRPGGHFVPAQIVGSLVLEEGTEEPVCLAIAVNGTIRATTCTYRAGEGRTRRWSALVPESSFVKGRNRVDALVIETERSGNLRLVPVILDASL